VSTAVTAAPTDPANPFSAPASEIVTSLDGKAFRFLYAAGTRTFTATSPVGRVQEAVYDERGLPVRVTQPGTSPVRYTHNAEGRLTEVRSGEGTEERLIRFTWDEKGRLQEMVDPAGRVRRFAHDNMGRLTSRTFAGQETRYAYDALGRIVTFTPPGRPAHRLRYTPTGKVAEYLPPAAPGATAGVAYTWSAAGALASVTRLDGRPVKLTHTATGAVTSAVTSAGTLTVEHDRQTGRVARAGSPSGMTTGFTFDGPLLTTITTSGPVTGSVTMHYGASTRLEGVSLGQEMAFAYRYDDDGLLTGAGEVEFTRDPASGRLTALALRGVSASWTHNGFGEPVGHREEVQGQPVFEAAYVRDALGRIVRRSERIGGVSTVEEYQYDDANGWPLGGP
jgi:YD repeat-containing protein